MSDKRTVVTDALETLGTIIGASAGRDAIHLAVEPVTAAQDLQPGEHVGIHIDGCVGRSPKPVGIVDPFLKEAVRHGQKFWLVVYPRQITSLRHVWSHPDFPEAGSIPGNVGLESTGHAAQWLREFVGKLDTSITYEEIIANAAQSDGTMYFGDEIYGEIPDEFWDHMETLTGKAFTNRMSYFKCGC